MDSLFIDVEKEAERMVDFIRITVKRAGFERVVVGVSGGVDSATVLALCIRALGAENVLAISIPYGETKEEDRQNLYKLFEMLKLPEENRREIMIKTFIDNFQFSTSNIHLNTKFQTSKTKNKKIKTRDELIRLGNIIARVRMIILYDLAKANNCLVCGTENKSEYLLGYYTRFGDEASDLEPIRHLYKTQVYQLAKYLGIPEAIINKKPTAGLWEGQTDQQELGFAYNEADEILYKVFEKKIPWVEIERHAIRDTRQVVELIKKRVLENWFKREVPYYIK